MILAATLALALQHEEILICKYDKKGMPEVTRDQWVYVHLVLQSRNSKWLLKIIHPKHDLVVRNVETSFPGEDGSIGVVRIIWSKVTVVDRIKKMGFDDVRHPGYAYEMTEEMDPDAPYYEGPLVMKGMMMYVKPERLPKDFKLIVDPSKKRNARYRADHDRLSPITYIKMAAYDGHTWLSEISSYVPAE